MSRATIKEYRAAKGGDYDCYVLSNGETYWLWLKAPFNGGESALVHIMTDDPTVEVGIVTIEKDVNSCRMSLNGKTVEVPITFKQYLKPNKKYFFDKVVKTFLIK
ncbi:hypothetical protein [Paenibacillus naphthalenovorans]|uniref:Uncharacterized protein n=1 Tax=Paenibacillus naphthalenovorans TaxID=162209 RepID=A0A0U2W426_9BACL|nr:hypothetical protein [Paenibacillus naphthalenovorans]ALS22245.1 hypothetical protein IJ22_18710 [Paenibacillus naphthalenovorans]